MLTSITKDFFFLSISQSQHPLLCTVVGTVWTRNVISKLTKRCKGIQKRREGKSTVTSNSNNSSLNPKKFLLQRKCQSYRKPETIKNVSSSQVHFFCHWQEKQTGGRVPAHASACSDPTMHRDTCRKTDLQAEETLDTEKLTVFARGLKGIFCFIP